MTSIKSLKKGDWVIFSKIVCDDNNYAIPEECSNLGLLFQTNKKCIIGKIPGYSEMKYWFEINENELVNATVCTRDEIIELYDSYDIEVHKIRTKEDKSWKDYCRSKRDYNWKYDIAVGINAKWVLFKRDMLKQYLESLKEARQSKNPMSIKYMEEAVDNLISGLSPEMKCGSSFSRGASQFSHIDIKKNVVFYDTMLNNYAALSIKYRNKIDSEIYYMLLDFEQVVLYAKAYLLSQSDIEIVTMIMNGKTNVDTLTQYINSNYEFKKPLKPEDIKFRMNETIPKILLKVSDKLENKFVDGEKNE